MKKNEKKKKKLSSLLFILFLTVIMLSTATYAWFTSNRTVTIKSINVHVETSGGLQISTDAENWKTVIENTDITDNAYSGNTNQFPGTLSPVSSAMAVNSSGHLVMYNASTGTNSGEYTLTTTLATEAAGTSGNFIAFDIFLKNEKSGTSDSGAIYLTTASDVTAKEGADDTGLKQSARVAFVNEGTLDPSGKAASDFIALNYFSTASDTNKVNGTNITLWEPNYNIHTSTGANSATYYFDQAAAPATDGSASRLAYLGVNQEFTGIPLRYSQQSSAEHAYFKSIDSSTLTALTMINTKGSNATTGSYVQALSAIGVTKVRVYMWIEGQDVDCENNASGSDITFNVVLSKNSSASE